MKILVVGGGSGGHITPAVAVIREILDLKPRTQVEFWTDRKYYKNVVKITTEIGVRWGENDGKHSNYIRVRKIWAGKFRRYAGWTWKDWLRNFDVVWKDLIWGNFVGLLGFIGGILQSFGRLLWPKTRPDVIFLKGGFVGLPVGLVARLFGIPYVVHESDTVPGLANRILMRDAAMIATGWGGIKGQDGRKIVRVGIPVAPEFKIVSATRQKTLKKNFGFDPEEPLVIFTGGSQGAENINLAVREILPELLEFTSAGLVAGRKWYEEMVDLKRYEEWDKAKLKSNFRMWEFNTTMNELLGAADVVVSRAGATTIAELAALEKAVILVPFERLPGGHQVKNAEKLAERGAVEVVLDEKMRNQPSVLLEEIRHLVRSPKKRESLAKNLHAETTEEAARKLAKVIIGVGGNPKAILEWRKKQRETRK